MRKKLSSESATTIAKLGCLVSGCVLGVGSLIFLGLDPITLLVIGMLTMPLFLFATKTKHLEFDEKFLYIYSRSSLEKVPLVYVDHVDNMYIKLRRACSAGKLILFVPKPTDRDLIADNSAPGDFTWTPTRALAEAVKKARANNL